MTIDLNSYLKKSLQITSTKALFAMYDEALKEFGYLSNTFVFFPPKINAEETVPICPHFNIPKEIICHYLGHKIYEVGPIFEKARTTGKTVVWSDFILNDKKFTRSRALEGFVKVIRDHGYKDGLTVPVYGASNSFGYFSFSIKDKKINIDEGELVILNHICIDLLKQYMRITKIAEDTPAALTIREKEVLGWVLNSKSNSVIADIMGISEHTVNTYIRRSCRKLGASGKWSAAVTAVLTGMVHH